jgi:hypothetical protein
MIEADESGATEGGDQQRPRPCRPLDMRSLLGARMVSGCVFVPALSHHGCETLLELTAKWRILVPVLGTVSVRNCHAAPWIHPRPGHI